MGEAYLHNHGGLPFLSITATLGNTQYIAGDSSDNGSAEIYARIGNETVRLYPDECVFSPTFVSVGTTAVTISKTIGSVTRSCSIPVTVYNISSTFGDNSWEQIAAAARIGRADTLWQAGDEKTETIGGTQHTFRILGFNHNNLSEDDEFYSDPNYNKGRGKAAITLQFKTVAGQARIHDAWITDQSTTWKDTEIYTETLSALYAQFPQDMKDVMRLVDVLCFDRSWLAVAPNESDPFYIHSERLTLIDSDIEVNSLRWLFDHKSLALFYYQHRDTIAPYELFRTDGYVGLDASGETYEWTRAFDWYNREHGYDYYSIAQAADYNNPRYTNNLPTDVKPFRPIFNI